MTFNVSVTKHAVESTTGHAGVTKGNYSQYVCDEDRWPLAIPMLREAVTDILHQLRRDISDVKIELADDEAVSIQLSCSRPTVSHLEDEAILPIYNAITRKVCSKWVRTFDEKLSSLYEADSDKMIEQALDFLRVRPVNADYEGQIHDDVKVNTKRCNWEGHMTESEAINCPLAD